MVNKKRSGKSPERVERQERVKQPAAAPADADADADAGPAVGTRACVNHELLEWDGAHWQPTGSIC